MMDHGSEIFACNSIIYYLYPLNYQHDMDLMEVPTVFNDISNIRLK